MLTLRAGQVTSPQLEAAVPKVPSPESKERSKVGNETAAPTHAQEDDMKKRQNVLERTLWTFIMIGGFISELGLASSASSLLNSPI
jgi:hypothetical protein